MKKILTYIFLAAALTACVDPELDFDLSSITTSTGTEVKTSENSISVNFTDGAGSMQVNLNSNSDWTAEVINGRADGWLTISPKSGSKSQTLSISVTANDTYDDRSATVRITCGSITRDIIVTQKQKDALTVTTGRFEVPAEGGSIQVVVKANIDYTYEVEGTASSWIQQSTKQVTKGLTERSLNFQIAENDDTSKREGSIIIKSGQFSETVKVYQDGSKPSIIISTSEYAVGSEGGEIKVEVKSNVNVSYVIPSEYFWVKEISTRTVSTNTFFFGVAANEGYDSRQAEIEFINSENGLSERIYIDQAQKDAIVIAKSRYDVDSDGDEIEMEVSSNVKYSCEPDVDWITPAATKALSTDKLRFIIAASDSPDSREGHIIIKSDNGAITQEVKVCQAQSDKLIISESEIAISDQGGAIEVEVRSNVEYTYDIIQGQDWLHESTTKALTTRTLRFIADKNETYESREAVIEVKSRDGQLKNTVTVTQAQKDAIVTAKSRYDVGNIASSISIPVSHNVDYTYSIDVSWIKARETKAFVTDRLTFDISENSSEDSREGTITFTSSDGQLSQTVKVCQSQMDQVIVGEWVKNLSSEGGNFDLEIKANIDYNFNIVQEGNWLHHVSTRAVTSKTLTFSADANPGVDSREAKIVVKSTNGVFCDTVYVLQAQKDAIVLAKSKYEIDNKGGEISIPVGHNVDFTYEINEEWVKAKTTKAYTTDAVVFVVDENTSYDNREATITFTSSDKKITQEVTVFQSQVNAIVISEKQKVISDTTSGFKVEIKSNVKYSYTIKQTGDWVKAVTTKGLQQSTVQFTTAANTGYEAREALIIFTSSDDATLRDTVTVTQAQKDAIVPAKDRYDIDNKGGEISIQVGHNIDFDYEIGAEWVRAKTTKAYTTDAVVFVVDGNTTYDSRETTIKFLSKDKKISQTVKVCQAQTDAIVISNKSLTLADTTAGFSVEIKANVDYNYIIKQDGSWIHSSTTRGLSSKTLKFTTDKNETIYARTGYIIVTSTNGALKDTVTVIQIQKDAIVPAKDRYDIDNKGCSITIPVGHNIDYSYSIDVDWIKGKTTKAYVTDSLEFVIDENSTYDNREGNITFKATGKDVQQTVKICQAQKNKLEFTGSKTINLPTEGGKFDVTFDSNINYTLASDTTWLTKGNTKTTTSGNVTSSTVSFTAAANSNVTSRTANIVLSSSADASLKDTIKVTQAQKDTMYLSKTTASLSNTGGDVSVTVTTNVEYDYAIENSVSWITLKSKNGDSYTFTVAKNTEYDGREATVTFTSKDKKIVHTFTVSQSQLDGLIVTGSKNREFDNASHNFDIEVKSNISYNCEIISGGTWISNVTPVTKALTSKTYNFSIKENTGYDSRTGKIVFRSPDGSLKDTVTVFQAQKDAIVISPSSLSAVTAGQELTIPVGHNVDFTYEISDPSWVHAQTTKAYTTTNVKFTVDANTTFDERKDTITFKSSDNKISQKVIITQAQKNKLEFTGSKTVNLPTEGGKFDVTFDSNINYTLASGATWLTKGNTKTTTSGNVTSSTVSFTAAANSNVTSRTANIVLSSSADASLKDTIKVIQAQKDTIILSKTTATVSNTGGDVSVTVTANIDYDWKSSASWVTKKSEDNGKFIFSVAATDEYDSRKDTITFFSAGNKIAKTLIITQSQANGLILNPEEQSFDCTAHTLEIEVQSNVQYSYSIVQTGTWVKYVSTKALTTKTLTFSVSKNDSYDSREALIVFKSNDNTIKDTVKVIQAQKDAIVISPGTIDVACTGGKISIPVQHNIDFNYTINDTSWIKKSSTKGLTTDNIDFMIDENTAYTGREGTITFKSKDGNLSQTVTIKQAQVNHLAVTSDKTVNFQTATGGNFKVLIDANVTYNYTIKPSGSWLTYVSKDDAGITFKAADNQDYSDREGSIIISSTDGSLKDTVKVIQHQSNAIIPASNSYSIENKGGDISIYVQDNVDYDVTITEGSEWLSIIRTKALRKDTVVVRAAENVAGTKRVGKIKIASGDEIVKEITITQSSETVLKLSITTTAKKVTYTLPTFTGNDLSGTIDWGDSKIGNYSSGASHQYNNAGTYTITVKVASGTTFTAKLTNLNSLDISSF